ncbi:MAG TPA: ABC transporter substrate-binding protein, partial [Casimicrobiaceae bacterium]|nr:ABC transporter substrate-binding protein [Casimicrobiaceae bacterium]
MIARILAIVGGAICFAVVPPVAAAQPDAGKTIRVAFPIAETGFDPQAGGDAYSNYVNRQIFDPLYKYEYLTRPYRLVPNTAAALPDISPDGKTWTIKIRPGIYFADDPAFKGKRRELTAADYVYSLKRLLDPKMRSNFLQIVEDRFVGADAVVAKARNGGTFDYDTPIEGLQAIDRYTLRFRLNFPDYELLANLTTTPTAAVAREVVEAYRDPSGWVMANPVGTGPYRLKDWRRAQRIVLEANPTFRDERYPEPASATDRALVKTLAGRKLPLVSRVEISIIEEANPRLLAFMQKQLDFLAVPNEVISNVMAPDGKLEPALAKQRVTLQRDVQPAISYLYFNMQDPVVGGYAPDRIALRRAIAMGYDADEEIRVIRQGQGMPMTQLIPPNMSGHDPTFNAGLSHDVAAAKALLDKFGYKDRDGDGYRELPDGRALTIKMAST